MTRNLLYAAALGLLMLHAARAVQQSTTRRQHRQGRKAEPLQRWEGEGGALPNTPTLPEAAG